MAKIDRRSAIATEIKKDYLVKHLKQIEELVSRWQAQLRAPAPFTPYDGILGWQGEYRPSLEKDPDSNHMLRSHVRSRTLWHHHTDWERKLALAWSLAKQLREEYTGQLPLGEGNDAVGIRNSYVGTALLAAFEAVRRNRSINIKYINYKIPEDGQGVACGDFKIDSVAMDQEQQEEVQKRHSGLARSLAQQEKMKQLIDCWREIEEVENRMLDLVSKTLKSRDILHPCRFCRHLWK